MKISFAALSGDEADDLIATLCIKYKNDFIIDIFMEIAKNEKDRVKLINVEDKTIETLQKEILDIIDKNIK